MFRLVIWILLNVHMYFFLLMFYLPSLGPVLVFLFAYVLLSLSLGLVLVLVLSEREFPSLGRAILLSPRTSPVARTPRSQRVRRASCRRAEALPHRRRSPPSRLGAVIRREAVYLRLQSRLACRCLCCTSLLYLRHVLQQSVIQRFHFLYAFDVKWGHAVYLLLRCNISTVNQPLSRHSQATSHLSLFCLSIFNLIYPSIYNQNKA